MAKSSPEYIKVSKLYSSFEFYNINGNIIANEA